MKATFAIDESGISAVEAFTLMVAVGIEDAAVYSRVEQEIQSLIDSFLPEEWRQEFVFHAVDLFGNTGLVSKYGLTPSSRKDMLFALLQMGPKLGLTLSVSATRRESSAIFAHGWGELEGSMEKIEHVMTFDYLLVGMERVCRRRGWENPHIVLEDNIEMRKFLKYGTRILDNQMVMPGHMWRETSSVDLLRDGGEYQNLRLGHNVAFSGKGSRALQLADAYAYAFQRYLNGRSYGDEMIRQFLPELPDRTRFANPAGCETWGI